MTDDGSPREEGGEADPTGVPPTGSGARLTRLKINHFRQVAPGTELRFDDGINVLLGRNGTGKTTLLELIVAVVRGDLRAYQQESFELEYELLLGAETLVVWIRNESSAHNAASYPFDRGLRAFDWNYRIHYTAGTGANHRIEATKGRTRLGDAEHPESPLFAAGFYESCIRMVLGIKATDFSGFRYRSGRLTRSLLRLDEGLDIFRSMTEGRTLPGVGKPLSANLYSGIPWGNSMESARGLLELLTIYVPTPLLEQLLEQGESVHTATEIRVLGDQWDVLDILGRAVDARSLHVRLELAGRTKIGQGDFGSTFGKPSFWITTHQGTTYTHDQLSYGEKRLLTFLYHAAANPEILVADELVNGLHHEWIQTCLDAIQGQAFLSSQNPLLLDHLPFSSAEEVERRFVLCDRDDQGNWLWRNMTPEEADSFYRAYEVGIQHVSEILETKGLW